MKKRKENFGIFAENQSTRCKNAPLKISIFIFLSTFNLPKSCQGCEEQIKIYRIRRIEDIISLLAEIFMNSAPEW